MLNNSKKLDDDEHLSGIVEFDETYFLDSHKGEYNLNRKARHRGGKATQRGVSSEQIEVDIQWMQYCLKAIKIQLLK